ncbi:sensor histidine kinase [Tamlana sp. 2201CG12-4]|uniref:tetratricopeptide repeat-containing sensor histidine kinase n=1 Tax=Tamlana sp. 2201CG12-4 TaxID=3112582 RepID=UPI002DB6F106|nr:sensor histidine kinase [Tamlana sp. 2201CG12-4]MEC3905842.1 sensor histidine kinase [Tamlana sp. 2201CG12-4]
MKNNLLFIVLFSCCFAFGQSNQIDSLTTKLKEITTPLEKAKLNLLLANAYERIDLNKAKVFAYKALKFHKNDSLLAETSNQLGRFHFFTANLDSASFYFSEAKTLLKKIKAEKRAAIINISLGAIELRKGNYENTIKILTESASFFEHNNDALNAAKCYSNISSAFAELDNFDKAIEYSEKALTVFNKNNLTQFQLITLPNLATQYFKKGDTLKAVDYYHDAETIAKSVNDNRSLSIIYNNLGNIYLNSDIKKSEAYLLQALALKTSLNLRSGIGITKSNLGYIYLKKKDYNKAVILLSEAEPLIKGKQLSSIYEYLSKSHKGLNHYPKALEFAEKAKQLNDSLLSAENQKTILDIQTKYETEKKEKEILQLKADNLEVNYKRRQNRNLLFATLIALIVAIFGISMILKNAKRKRIIMEQNLTIQEQNFNQLLKSQELEGIDAILDAQEQERNKMAADLHDNLGSKIATLKLYLESYDENDSFSNFYQKLKSLMNETYSEIRSIAKNKNFGTQIDKGLIPSTKNIAKQISYSNKLDIKVINVDVKNRIENTLEIQLFRIIQELLTNIIKHADATEAIVQFSEDENVLNIIVEDNGKGFDMKQKRIGTGLINIERRVDKINAELVIDSSEGSGTTVILNIPL